MKKLLFSAFLVLSSIATFAVADARVTGTFVSSCGVTWSVIAHGATMGEAFQRLSALESACDAACGTKTTQIIM